MKALLYQSLHGYLKIGLPTTFAAVVLSNFSPLSISPKSLSSAIAEISWGQAAQAQSSTQIAVQLDWTTLEQQIITEHNRVRQDPQSYIPKLEAYMATMNEDGHIVHGCGQN
ncbi:MAG: hypothetical protein WA984_02080, partial [Phormidesmis sp.]